MSTSASLWIGIIAWYLWRGRVLALDCLTSISDLYSDPVALRRVVLRTDRLEQNWRSPKPEAATLETFVALSIKQESQRDFSGFSFINEGFLLLYWSERSFDVEDISSPET